MWVIIVVEDQPNVYVVLLVCPIEMRRLPNLDMAVVVGRLDIASNFCLFLVMSFVQGQV
jgi:hypothetical protein